MLEIFLEKIPDVIGLFGVSMLLLVYFLLNTDKLLAVSLKYQLLNLIGAVAILISLFFHFNLSSFVIEIAWILISLIGIRRALKLKI